MRRNITRVAACFLVVAGCTAFGPGAAGASSDGEEVLARVNGETLTMTDLQDVLERIGAARRPTTKEGIAADAVLKRLIENRLLEQEGYRTGAAESPEIEFQVRDLVEHKAMMALMDSVSSGIAEAGAADMDSVLNRTNRMNRLSHILVMSPQVAEVLLDSLAGGASFADLADRHSLDKSGAGRGGDLGWAREGLFLPEFEQAIRGLGKGEVAGPVQTEKGWHLLLLADTRTETIGQSDKMKDAMREKAIQERVMKKMRDYVASIKKKHGVVVDEPLLASLDFGSTDPAVQKELRNSDAVLAELAGRPFTVGRLAFEIRFENFHGIEGKPDAAAIRDRVFDEWVTEAVLRHEARLQGLDNRPEIVAAGRRTEHELLREAVLGIIFSTPYEPGEPEVAAYHAAHPEEFTAPPRVRIDGVLLEGLDAATAFHDKLAEGAQVSWLADRTPDVRDADPEIFANWLDPDEMEELRFRGDPGAVVGPVFVQGFWAVGRITKVETPAPTPLEQCREQVIRATKVAHQKEVVRKAMDRLRSASTIEIMPGAEERIEQRLAEWMETGRP